MATDPAAAAAPTPPDTAESTPTPAPADVPDREECMRLGLEWHIDPRTVRKEALSPGSVTGRAGDRARKAVAAWRRTQRAKEHAR